MNPQNREAEVDPRGHGLLMAGTTAGRRRGGEGSWLCAPGCPALLSLSSHPCPPHPTQTTLRECEYKQFISVLDTNKDCQVDFVEYMRLLACLCVYCHESFKDSPLKPSCSQ